MLLLFALRSILSLIDQTVAPAGIGAVQIKSFALLRNYTLDVRDWNWKLVILPDSD
jgi:hypothetical protein